MLYQPTNVYPSMTGALGNGVVDANGNLTVSWQVNGNSPLTAFQIVIYDFDAAVFNRKDNRWLSVLRRGLCGERAILQLCDSRWSAFERRHHERE